jgi:hypothetical protein
MPPYKMSLDTVARKVELAREAGKPRQYIMPNKQNIYLIYC